MFALVLGVLFLAAHPDSMSFSRVEVEGPRVTAVVRMQALSLMEVVAVDADEDGFLTTEELAAQRGAVRAYFAEHYRILDEDGPLAFEVTELEVLPPDSGALFSGLEEQWLHLELAAEARRDVHDVSFEIDVFLETSPDHRDFSVLVWNGKSIDTPVFSAGLRAWTYDPFADVPERGFLDWVRLGFDHILGGFDHLCFLVALIVASRGLRPLLLVITAFTLSHSVTLALAALDVFSLPGRVVELAIALSIAYVGVETLLRKEPRDAWVEAFLFGLIHGMGFAGFLAESLFAERDKVVALLGFNLGVELGQVVVAGSLAGLLALAFRKHEGEGLAPRPLSVVTSVVVVILGLWWFFERV